MDSGLFFTPAQLAFLYQVVIEGDVGFRLFVFCGANAGLLLCVAVLAGGVKCEELDGVFLQRHKENGIGFPYFRKKIHRVVCRVKKINRIFA